MRREFSPYTGVALTVGSFKWAYYLKVFKLLRQVIQIHTASKPVFICLQREGTCYFFLSLTTADIIIIAALYQLWMSKKCWKA